jgi:predicted DNA-binding transcriptional regulator AlpA
MSAVAHPKEQSIKILRLPQVCDVTGLGRSMIYQMEADKRFPKRSRLGPALWVDWKEKCTRG